jgi:hypothetical protein
MSHEPCQRYFRISGRVRGQRLGYVADFAVAVWLCDG